MLFHSREFLFLFLPIVLLGWLAIRARSQTASLWWLVAGSLVFYSAWDWRMLPLFLASILINFAAGRHVSTEARTGRKATLAAAIALNVGALGYCKYAPFLLTTLNQFLGTALPAPHPILPLAISFFTFQQIAYLVECYRGRAGQETFLEYLLFVTFFPQLIAGPIIHHREILPQLRAPERRRFDNDFAVGLTILAIGLFKKCFLADTLSQFANPAFTASHCGFSLSVTEAWVGTLAFTLQIYFDFSGYSDMAIGLGRMFGVRLPLNFDSPLKSTSLSELWRRWHMTLGRFLREHCFLPLGGMSRSLTRRCLAIGGTMVICGVWHGSGWTFLAWGASHAVVMMVEHIAQSLRRRKKAAKAAKPPAWRLGLQCVATTFLFAVSLVLFRSPTMEGAGRMASALFRWNQEMWFSSGIYKPIGLRPEAGALWVLFALGIVWGLPNTQQFMGRFRPAIGYQFRYAFSSLRARTQWRPRWTFAAITAVLFCLAITSTVRTQEFIYFQF